MTSKIKSCYIYSDDPSLLAIYLPDETPVLIGRSPETKITDSKCSRNQVRLYASYANQRVLVQQIGQRSCGLNGFKLTKEDKYQAKHGDQLELLYGNYCYRIEFNPPPSETSLIESTKRKIVSSDSEDEEIPLSSRGKKPKIFDKNLSNDKNLNIKEVSDNSNESMDTCLENKHSKNENSVDKSIKNSWEEFETLMIYTSSGVKSQNKIASYDMDNTLITTKSGYAFPKDHDDWQILYAEVPGKLKKLHSEGYKIVIFTNQGGMFIGKIKPNDFKLKIERVVKKLGVPIQVFIAVGKDTYRKPRIGMWEKLVKDKNEGVPIDKSESFFVGDAAGRAKDWAPKKKKDHSSADRLLGFNLEMAFHTPEEHFLGHKRAPFVLPEFNPKKLSKNGSICEPADAKLTSTKQEVIIMVGGPGSGKSHVARTYLKNYHYINRDKLGSWQKCVSSMENALIEGKNVVIDNTNPDAASRKRFIDVAKSRKIPVRCFVMTTEKEHARHNNKFRELTDPSHMIVTDVIINSYSYTNSTLIWRCTRFVKLLFLMCLRLLASTMFNNVQLYRKNYVPPKLDEGFAEIVKINFVPRFDNDKHQKLYEMYLLEK